MTAHTHTGTKAPKRPHVNCITINTDASFHPQKKVAGYAFTIVFDKSRLKGYGVFKKQQPKNAIDAELMCIGNALHTLYVQQELPTSTLLVINSDCIHAYKRVLFPRKQEDAIALSVAAILAKVMTRIAAGGKVNATRYEFRHVKAHTKKKDARSKVNDWCDKAAKAQMRNAAKEIEKQP